MRQVITFISLPPMANVTVIKNGNSFAYYVYNNFFFYKIGQNSNKYYHFFDTETNTISFIAPYYNPFSNLFLHFINIFLFSWNNYFYEKIKFTGKGYRIELRKKKKIITFYFGHSHDTIILFRSIILIQAHKYKFIVVKNSWQKLRLLNRLVTKIKPMNIYTKRGIRNARQVILKRKGKKSAYI